MIRIQNRIILKRSQIIGKGNRFLNVFDRETKSLLSKYVSSYAKKLRERFRNFTPNRSERLKKRTGSFYSKINQLTKNSTFQIVQVVGGNRRYNIESRVKLNKYESIHDADKPTTITPTKGKHLAIPSKALQVAHPTHTPPGPRQSGKKLVRIISKKGNVLLLNKKTKQIDYILKESVVIKPRLRSRDIAEGKFTNFKKVALKERAKYRARILRKFKRGTSR